MIKFDSASRTQEKNLKLINLKKSTIQHNIEFNTPEKLQTPASSLLKAYKLSFASNDLLNPTLEAKALKDVEMPVEMDSIKSAYPHIEPYTDIANKVMTRAMNKKNMQGDHVIVWHPEGSGVKEFVPRIIKDNLEKGVYKDKGYTADNTALFVVEL